ncbi:hypothetical protein HETIRDRAFT_164798 [Heterobasidion irregulare TC 32-1]|uniref:Uncharacterized protein n=1 Tax=Heterobasidion irregulare (strain TC 32-1) TaxID=747525 RepID=W4JPK4_HETIT|nr:uncharacterized protein HETIRDRAFT_164798 [Heterobasidion irregulare TC 32-1]ETW75020.1 hypothetical protein HETIRDRAFT_164798 [Heterobasidion irregulare TC 32-1]
MDCFKRVHFKRVLVVPFSIEFRKEGLIYVFFFFWFIFYLGVSDNFCAPLS